MCCKNYNAKTNNRQRCMCHCNDNSNGLKRRYISEAERTNNLQTYKEELLKEIAGVEEAISKGN